MGRAESCAGIGDTEIDPIVMSRQLNLGLRSSAVLHDIPQGLLHDPKQAHRDRQTGLVDCAVERIRCRSCPKRRPNPVCPTCMGGAGGTSHGGWTKLPWISL